MKKKQLFPLLSFSIIIVSIILSFILSPTLAFAASSNYITKVETTDKRVALTFDDGSDGTNINTILAILDDYGIKATFFLTGAGTEDHPQSIQNIVNAGHDIGNHSYNHPHFPQISASEMQSQLSRAESIIFNLTGKSTKPYFRAPFGEVNNNVLSVVGNAGYTYTFHWSVDTGDWTGNSSSAIYNRVVNNVSPGAIVLMHTGAGASGTPGALESFIPDLQSQGYQFVTLTQLLNSSETPAPNPDTGSGTTYIVRAGDTLYRIATAHNTTVAALAAANNITNHNLLTIGQVLKIPNTTTPPPTPTPTPTPTRTYTVQRGDTLYNISVRFNTTVSALASANNITNRNLISVGQQLMIPGSPTPAPTPTPTPNPNPTPEPGTVYTVQRGDTLYNISVRFNTTVASLAAANNITNSNIISVGQRLTIPGTTTPAPQPQPTPAPIVYTVKAGDTLYSIAVRNNTTVAGLVELNGLTNPNALKIGQVLKLK